MNPSLSRRRWISSLAASVAGVSASGWFPLFAQQQLAEAKKKSRHVILLWMSGGPSQMDTWDLKPGHVNGGEFKEIQTASPGLRFSEYLPKLAAIVQPSSRAARSVDARRGSRTRHLLYENWLRADGAGSISKYR